MKIYAVYIDQLPGPDQFERMMAMVSDDKRKKVNRYRFPEDANRTLIGEVVIRHIIKKTFDLPNEQITFTEGRYGKPSAEDLPDFHFNTSHSGKWIICGVGRRPIGVDVEKIKPINFDIAQRFFSPAEHRDLLEKRESERLSYFYHLWTMKESFIKLAGKGLSLPLDSFSVKLGEGGRASIETPPDYPPCHLQVYEIDPGYKMAVCSESQDFPKDVVLLTYEDLLNG
ncbi:MULTISPECIES: 4'-phosphopantetheinyl transferase family protein [Bacillus]|uniref:4'-phosphopantetheinyl transferase family protein n=1 Tax=Bacillus TaxID=1386 RepID=UPI000429ED36|nr:MULTISPECIES: 4'-phosphopantetheinyl transferase superfamily protein [Bacillus]QHZ48654.1 4'-phosphopantetheinyl transferase superfamily protein [Bacillus sp. NSP9.1]WFA05702.1 4'-phosphopantetheinyl transferase superfamily protein [Bacillus sp. HSf4]